MGTTKIGTKIAELHSDSVLPIRQAVLNAISVQRQAMKLQQLEIAR